MPSKPLTNEQIWGVPDEDMPEEEKKDYFDNEEIDMIYLRDRCLMLWWSCVKYRDKWCQICGWTPSSPELLEAHHLYFKSHGNWRVLFDTDFGVSLCNKDHQIKDHAPHQSNQKFLEMIVPRIQQDCPERAAKILKFLNEPVDVCREKVDYRKINKRLTIELKERKEKFEMDKYDHDAIWRGRPEEVIK